MKPLCCIGLLIALLAPSGGTMLWVYWQKVQVRKAVKEQMIAGMPEQELVWLKFSAEEARSELEWEHDREFEYRGQMYDVVRSEVKGDTTFYLCWPDAAETALNRQLEQLVAESTTHDPAQRICFQRLFDFFQLLYYHHIGPEKAYLPTGTALVAHRSALSPPSPSFPPPVPPPRV